ncbi:MAG: hypothetical protein ACRD37_05610 [Candidatus Acidiferrales bacterium]
MASPIKPPATGGRAAPKVINIVHEALVPGKEAAYAGLLAKIADGYNRAKIPVYWLESQSFTGAPDAMSLNFFDSFADAETALHALGVAAATHPELTPMQQQLLTYTSSVTNAIAVRRDDIGYRADAIDFSKARILRVATVVVRQGREEEFAEAIRGLASAYEKVNADSPWVLYHVNAGAPATTFVFFMPMRSLGDMDAYIARAKPLREAEGQALVSRMQEVARNAYVSWDSELFAVNAPASHVSAAFAAGDPQFWMPANH